ncbi:nucleotidyltransferase family protein [candidate division KSB1 bacterium]|nr:nucleotidyltransferase family protein [candidate division KSB1 bacterium]
MLDLYAEFEKALDALEQHQINYALCGGLAVTLLAQPRFTEDIDILVSPDDCERCKAILQPLGFKFFSTPMRFDNDIVEVHKLTKIDPGDHDYIFLDVISAISPVAREILSQRIRLAWKDKQVWVVSRPGLIKLKEASKRPKDQLDIDALKGESK